MANRKNKVRTTKIADKIHLGEEGKYQGKVLSNIDLIRAYNWYNYFCEQSDSKRYTLTWLNGEVAKQTDKVKMLKVIERIASVKEYHFRTIGWVCRLLSVGAILPKQTIEFRNQKIAELVKLHTIKIEEDTAEEKPTRTPEQKLQDQMSDIIGYMDSEVDRFDVSVLKPFDYLSSKQLKVPQLKKIAAYYKPIYSETVEAIKKPDAQLKEGYSHLKKAQLKQYSDFVVGIINAVNTLVDLATIAAETQTPAQRLRKPRKRKAKTAEQLAAKLVFKKDDPAYKIKSIEPRDIIRAAQLWVFNTKTRVLCSYVSSDVDGLNIKGTTIIGFDEKLSVQKKLRKPEAILQEVVDGGKVTLRRLLENVKSKEMKVKGRVNKDVVLLRVLK